MKNKTLKLIVDNSGDYSVGEPGFNLEVTVDSDDLESFEDFQNDLKVFLMEYFSHYNGKTSVMTQKELDDLIDREDLKNEGF